MTVAIRPPVATGLCATPGCRLPAQPGRGKCAECISNGIGASSAAPPPTGTRICIDCPAEIDSGANGQRIRCNECSRTNKNQKDKARQRMRAKAKTANPERDQLLAKMQPTGMDGFRGRVNRAHRFPGQAKK